MIKQSVFDFTRSLDDTEIHNAFFAMPYSGCPRKLADSLAAGKLKHKLPYWQI